jgi:anti-anti-sigma factor
MSVTTIAVTGELDRFSQSGLADAIERVWSQPCGPAVLRLDLSGVELIDTSALALLLFAHRRARERGCDLRVGPLSPQVARVFTITGVAAILADAAAVGECSADLPWAS